MSLSDAIATLPEMLRVWVLWLTIAMVTLPLVMLAWRATRRDGIVCLAAAGLVIVAMHGLHAQIGIVRLLGLPHIVVWTPLAVYLAWRLRNRALPGPPRAAMAVLLVSIAISLVFDYRDVALWLAGDRAPMTSASARG